MTSTSVPPTAGSPRTPPPGRQFLPLAAAALLALAAACASDGPSSPTPPPTITIDPALSGPCARDLAAHPPDLTVFAADPGDFLADRFSLAAGDFNGDGLDDALIGAPLADGPDNARQNAGEAYVVFGAADLSGTLDLASTPPALLIAGEAAGDNLGFTVAAGDVNGDGIDDILVGARFASTPERPQAGKAYVVFGRHDLGGTVDTAAAEQDVTVVGNDQGDFLSIALATGDVNGDGTDDLLLGASGDGPLSDRRDAGETAVVLGGGLPHLIDLADTPPPFIVHGAAPGDRVPNHIAAGDTDDDGRDELILGAPQVDGAGGILEAGRVYVVPVPPDGGRLDLADGEGFSVIIGGGQRDAFGVQVASGDLDGDGLDDVIAGARDADGPEDKNVTNNAGEVHVLFGATLPAYLDLSGSRSDFVLVGGGRGDSLGFALAAADLNGDGLHDLLAAAPLADSCDDARPDAGDAYAVLGRPGLRGLLTVTEIADLSFLGLDDGDELGFSIAAGDFNGDGLDDVLLGALQADGPDNDRPDAGEAYIVLSEGP